jgi:hypothetical protein
LAERPKYRFGLGGRYKTADSSKRYARRRASGGVIARMRSEK